MSLHDDRQLFWISLVGFLFFLGLALVSIVVHVDKVDWELVEKTLVAEAASEGEEGIYAVGCVMRRRNWNLKGFSASKRRDLEAFYQRQPEVVRRIAHQVLAELRMGGRDTTLGSTHYENVDAFGTPSWSKGMAKTVKIGRHTFWRRE